MLTHREELASHFEHLARDVLASLAAPELHIAASPDATDVLTGYLGAGKLAGLHDGVDLIIAKGTKHDLGADLFQGILLHGGLLCVYCNHIVANRPFLVNLSV